jgi:hypothetical protein
MSIGIAPGLQMTLSDSQTNNRLRSVCWETDPHTHSFFASSPCAASIRVNRM